MEHDLEAVVPHIQEPKALKEAVKQLYHKYCGTRCVCVPVPVPVCVVAKQLISWV